MTPSRRVSRRSPATRSSRNTTPRATSSSRPEPSSSEERAELAKHHIDVLWSDYFKPEHVQKYPEITELCWKAAKQCSKVKGSLDLADAKTLLDMIDKIADVWTKAGGPQATRVAKAAAARA